MGKMESGIMLVRGSMLVGDRGSADIGKMGQGVMLVRGVF